MEDKIFRIKHVNISNKEISNNNVSKIKINSNIDFEKELVNEEFNFKVGMRVKHKEENIVGEIKFIGKDKIAVVWEDNTRERIEIDSAYNELSYVDDIQTIISPTSPQISKQENVEAVNEVIDKALSMLDEEEYDDMVESSVAVDDQKIDVEKITMQRKINQLENKLHGKQMNGMKENIAKELVDVAIMKNIIDEEDSELELQKIIVMDDNEFEDYKESILSYESDGSEVTSEFDDDPNLSEAERALKRIKGNGGKGIIGDFSKNSRTTSSSVDVGIDVSEGTRSLANIKDKKFTYSNMHIPPTFEEQFDDILSESVGDTSRNVFANEKGELPGFENLRGLTKPIKVTDAPMVSFPTNTDLKSMMSSLDWTTISKTR